MITVTQSMISKYSKCGLQGYLSYFGSDGYLKNLENHNGLDPKDFSGNGFESKTAFHLPLYQGSLMDKAIEQWKDRITNHDFTINYELAEDKSSYDDIVNEAIQSICDRFIGEDTDYNPDELDFSIKQAKFALPEIFKRLTNYYKLNGVAKTATKVKFVIDIIAGHKFSGEMDEICITEDDRIEIIDYKLLSSFPDETLLEDDLQGKTYVMALKLYDSWDDKTLGNFLDKDIKEYDISKFAKFCIKKPSIRQRNSESLTEYRNRYIENIVENIGMFPVHFGKDKINSAIGEINSFCENKKYKVLSKSRFGAVCKYCDFKEVCISLDNVDVAKNLLSTGFKEKEQRNRELFEMKLMKDLDQFFEFYRKVPEEFSNRLEFLMHVSRNPKILVSDPVRENFIEIYKEFFDKVKNKQLTHLQASRLLGGGRFDVPDTSLEKLVSRISLLHNEYINDVKAGKEVSNTIGSSVEVNHQEDDLSNELDAPPEQVSEEEFSQLTSAPTFDASSSIKEAEESALSESDIQYIKDELNKLPYGIQPVKGNRRSKEQKALFDKWNAEAKKINVDLKLLLDAKKDEVIETEATVEEIVETVKVKEEPKQEIKEEVKEEKQDDWW